MPKYNPETGTLRIHLSAEKDLHALIKRGAKARRLKIANYSLGLVLLGLETNQKNNRETSQRYHQLMQHQNALIITEKTENMLPTSDTETDTTTIRIHINAEKDLHERLKKAAKSNRMNLGAFCLRLIEIGLVAIDKEATSNQ